MPLASMSSKLLLREEECCVELLVEVCCLERERGCQKGPISKLDIKMAELSGDLHFTVITLEGRMRQENTG